MSFAIQPAPRFPTPTRRAVPEREFRQASGDLEAQSSAWRSGESDCQEFKDRIRSFHERTARDPCKAYNDGDPAANVTVGAGNGVLQREEIPA